MAKQNIEADKTEEFLLVSVYHRHRIKCVDALSVHNSIPTSSMAADTLQRHQSNLHDSQRCRKISWNMVSPSAVVRSDARTNDCGFGTRHLASLNTQAGEC